MVLVTPDEIYCANAGDTRAVLKQVRGLVPLSFDHVPNRPCETARILAAGKKVSNNRVQGELAVSRGFGDFSFKQNDKLS